MRTQYILLERFGIITEHTVVLLQSTPCYYYKAHRGIFPSNTNKILSHYSRSQMTRLIFPVLLPPVLPSHPNTLISYNTERY